MMRGAGLHLRTDIRHKCGGNWKFPPAIPGKRYFARCDKCAETCWISFGLTITTDPTTQPKPKLGSRYGGQVTL